ncbi:MAG TPA: glycine--tRNA ligase [Candidatus Nanoarchaeia archaeon]|nr:glycine--tRNA ligase [Candidatus Nanoarchaeia archaeon]
MSKEISVEEMASFCKKKGFVYQNSDIYGGLSGFFDFGHLGVELKNNIKQEWWKYHVRQRDDIVGIDGCIIANPKVWEASGHVSNFADLMVSCKKCKSKYRADTFIEDALAIKTEGMKAVDINKLIKENNLKCPNCGGDFEEVKDFNLMFKTNVGPHEKEESTAYLRPETAQLIFTNFKLVSEHARLKLPFGIAQTGKSFRNEISPRDFLFRCREFEQMEIEYFIHPEKINDCPYISEVLSHEINVLSAEMQEKEKSAEKMKIKEIIEKKIIKTQWHAYWLAVEHKWFISLGADAEKFRIRQHLGTEKSHYALDTWDLEYNFPFGWKELQGVANRTDFDIKQHMEHSKKELSLFDEESKTRIVPYVVCEPSQGVERAFLVFMFDAYSFDAERDNIVLRLHPKLAPIKVAVFPLLANKPELVEKARFVYNLLKTELNCQFDLSGSIGRRYARQDEQGTPYCVTVDFTSLENEDMTIRDRDTTEQKRIPITEVGEILRKLISNEITVKDL